MSSILRKFAQNLDFVSQSRAPLDTNGARPVSGVYEKRWTDFHDLIVKPAFRIEDLPAYLDALENMNGVGLDDRQLLLEKMLVAMSRLKEYPSASMMIQKFVITLLYKDLPHPPSTYLTLPPPAPEASINAKPAPKYMHRSADGSNYNPLFPTLGKAGSPYARSVPSKHTLSKDSLPDPGLVFDTLLLRDKYEEHPGGISSLFFAFADLVIHSIFDTNHFDWSINDASSYLDLSVLYGSSEDEVASVRRFDGTGRLWNDVFADSRLLHMPPASCALLVLLNRNHNYIAQKLLDINEGGKFKKTFASENERITQDDEIFHRTRLVNCGYFMHIILGDYVGAILGLARDGSDWRLDPLMTIRNSSHDLEPTGEGNVVSVEFNLLYRWHSTFSEKDAEWTASMFDKLFDGKDPKDVSINDFKAAAHKYLIPTTSVREWSFGELKRDANGQFNDDDLANILHNATEWRSSAFKARGIPAAMRIIEIMGIQQARSWGTCSLNEFRKFIGLKPYATFKEWNEDPEIARAAQSLYKNIDNLELYVGLQAEQAKAAGPGAGLCPGYTISRAILADAVCLTRGDRFFTSDFTPSNLTSWGFQDCQYDTDDGSYGGLLTKLLFRTLPHHYPRGSAYAHFPFMTPGFMKENLRETNPGLVEKYTWTRPRKQPTVVPVRTYAGAKQVLSDDRTFLSAADTRLFIVAKPVITKKLAKETWRNNEKRISQLKTVDKELVRAKDEVYSLIVEDPKALGAYFAKKANELIKTKSFNSADKSSRFVDIIQDVINLVPIHWIAQEIAGLPVKTSDNLHGAWTEEETYQIFSDIAEYVHLNLAPENDWRLRETSQTHCARIVEFIKEHVDRIATPFSFAADTFNHMAIGDYHSHDFLKKAFDALGKRYSHREIASHVFAAVIPTAAIYSATVAQIVDFFLEDAQTQARTEILQLLKSSESDAPAKLENYIREAIRINPPVPGFYRTAGREVVVGPQTVQAFEVIWASVTSANLDESVFGPEPSRPDYNRPVEKAGIVGFGENTLVSEKFLFATVPGILGAIFEQKGIRRGPSRSGRITSFEETWQGSPRELYFTSAGAVSQFPDSLVIEYNPSA